MAERMLRLLAVLALLLMPVGMAAANAAPPAPAAGHCDGHGQPADSPEPMTIHCASCSALPALDGLMAPMVPPVGPALGLTAAVPIRGIDPETVTPPPRRA